MNSTENSTGLDNKKKPEKKPKKKTVNTKRFCKVVDGTSKYSSVLYKKRNESTADAEARLIDNGWSLDKVPYHWSPNESELHYGTIDKCRKCEVKNSSNEPTKQSKPRRFEHIQLKSEDDVVKHWNAIPKGRVPVAYMHYKEKGTFNHLTMYFVPCTLQLAVALYRFGKMVMSKHPKLEAKVLKESNINSWMYPGKKIYEVKVRLDRDTRVALNRLGVRGWVSHITDHTNKLDIGTTVTLFPEIEVIFAQPNKEIVEVGVESYYESLKMKKTATKRESKETDQDENHDQEKVEHLKGEGECSDELSGNEGSPDDGDSASTSDLKRRVEDGSDKPSDDNGR